MGCFWYSSDRRSRSSEKLLLSSCIWHRFLGGVEEGRHPEQTLRRAVSPPNTSSSLEDRDAVDVREDGRQAGRQLFS